MELEIEKDGQPLDREAANPTRPIGGEEFEPDRIGVRGARMGPAAYEATRRDPGVSLLDVPVE